MLAVLAKIGGSFWYGFPCPFLTVAEMEWEGGHQSQPSSTAEDMGKWLSEEMWTTRQKDSARLPGPA